MLAYLKWYVLKVLIFYMYFKKFWSCNVMGL